MSARDLKETAYPLLHRLKARLQSIKQVNGDIALELAEVLEDIGREIAALGLEKA